jgi:hypothetical protein
VTRGRLAVHAHFYQPSRLDPWSGRVPEEPGAAPFHDWNARVDAECYRPNAQRGNLERISWDLGPTLATWLATEAPATHAGFARAAAGGNAMAQAFHHTILPLASAADRRTEIRWGLRDFELRFGRRSAGLWLPETAVDLPTLRIAAEEGVRYTILAPWQAGETGLDSRHPYRVDVGGGASIVVAFYDAGLSAAVSFEPEATSDADRFARERVAVRLSGAPVDASPLALIATDGELYGHHQQFRDLFLQRLSAPDAVSAERRGFDVVSLADAIAEPPGRPHPTVRIVERTSWSCHHGVARWSAECPDAIDGRWKGPLRAALERLAAAIDAASERWFASVGGGPDLDFWTLRDAYGDVVIGALTADAFARDRLAGLGGEDRARALALLEAQRWRLAMFASDAWFWDDPIRPETKQVLRSAARAVRLVDGELGTALEGRLVADLVLFASPSRGLDGAAIYRTALAEIGQPSHG